MLNADLSSSDLLTNPSSTPSENYKQYYDTLISLLNKYAPLKIMNITHKTNNPWFSKHLMYHKQRKRQLERLWRKERSPLCRSALRRQINLFNRLVSQAKSQYFSNNISQFKNNPRKLWNEFDKLLHKEQNLTLPTHCSNKDLADSFATYFSDKIKKKFVLVSPVSPFHSVGMTCARTLAEHLCSSLVWCLRN